MGLAAYQVFELQLSTQHSFHYADVSDGIFTNTDDVFSVIMAVDNFQATQLYCSTDPLSLGSNESFPAGKVVMISKEALPAEHFYYNRAMVINPVSGHVPAMSLPAATYSLSLLDRTTTG